MELYKHLNVRLHFAVLFCSFDIYSFHGRDLVHHIEEVVQLKIGCYDEIQNLWKAHCA